jgi:O-antigen biosynthesis protein
MHPDGYYEHARPELLELFVHEPRRLLDVGCGAGGASAEAKRRWPSVETIGIETVAGVAEISRARVDRVICASAETLEFSANGIEAVDAVLLGDVLEHLVDPWSFLRRLRAILVPGATVAASVPNAANLWLIEELASGRFEYEEEGLLDATHLRFFSRATIERMFVEAGYRIELWKRVFDGRANDILRNRITGSVLPQWVFGRMSGHRVTIRNVGREQFDDLRTIQYLLRARVD